MRLRRLAALLALLAAIPVLAGCGSDAVLTSDAVADAADRTVSRGGAKLAIAQSISIPGQAAPLRMTARGVADPKARQGRLVFDLSGLAAQSGGQVDPGATQEVLYRGFTMYMRSPLFARGLPDGKRWIRIDLERAGKSAGIDLGALAQTGQDPTQALQQLRAASGDVERVGDEQVRGVSTTRYRATVDLRRYPDVVPPAQRAAVRRSIARVIELSGQSRVPTDVWIDGDDVVRRTQQTVRTLLGPGMRGTIRQRIDLYDFGQTVDVKTPPAAVTYDITDDAAQGLKQQLGSGSERGAFG
jgi:hypothetical protein